MSDTTAEDLADLYDEAPCGYLSLSPDGRIAKANNTIARWLGVSSTDLVGKPLLDIMSFGGKIAYETHIAPLLRLQGKVEEVSLDLLHADGSKIPVMANAAEKRAADRTHLFTRLTVLKAVDRRIYERSLQAALAQAEAAYLEEHGAAVLREQFIAVLGHDLRNPLAAITAGIQMLNGREQLSDRGAEVVSQMLAAIARASGLIDNVLDFARAKLGNVFAISRNDAAPLTPVLEQVVSEMQAIAPQRTIEAEFTIDEPIDCDRGKIGQLLSNLLANAVTHGSPQVPITVRAYTADSELVISVTNGGEPIDSRVQEQLFQPFFRGDVRGSQQGLGLGLFIVSEIAKAHDGSIDVTSSEQETSFIFRMPVSGGA